jgi:tRNA threonylcarbamoyladenosine biosynthesis protein TsaB
MKGDEPSMVQLVLDTSTSIMTVGLANEAGMIGEVTTNLTNNHSIRLLPSIEWLMKQTDIKPTDLQTIAVGIGPGSYTGVRIGVTTAKSLAWSLKLPLTGLSSLQAIAIGAGSVSPYIVPLVDARRGQVYTGLYRWEDNRLITVIPDRITLLQQWLTELTVFADKGIAFTGEGIPKHSEALVAFQLGQKAGQVELHRSELGWIQAKNLVALLRQGQGHAHTDHAYDLVPNYTQLAEAEAKWEATQK